MGRGPAYAEDVVEVLSDWAADRLLVQHRPDRGGARPAAAALAAQLLGLPADAVRCLAVCPDCGGPHGQPRAVLVDGTPSGAWVSITHTAAGSFVAATTLGSLGLDAEAVAASPDAMRRWTRTEAVLKADGRGLRVDPAAVRWHDDGATASIDGDAVSYQLVELAQPEGVVLSAVVRR